MIKLCMMFSGLTETLNEFADWVGSHLDTFLLGLGGTTLSGIGIGFGVVLVKSLVQKWVLKKSTTNLSNVATYITTKFNNFKTEIKQEFLIELQELKTSIITSVSNLNDTRAKIKAELYKKINDGTLSLQDLQTNKDAVISGITTEITGIVEQVNESTSDLKEIIEEQTQEVIEEITENVSRETNNEEIII